MDSTHGINWHPDLAQRRRFGWRLLAMAPVVALAWFVLVRWRAGAWNWQVPAVIAGVAVPLGLLCVLCPRAALPVYRLWHGVAFGVDFVLGRALLAAAFFLVLTPVGWWRRARGRDPLGLRPDPAARTYWREAPPPPARDRYFKQF